MRSIMAARKRRLAWSSFDPRGSSAPPRRRRSGPVPSDGAARRDPGRPRASSIATPGSWPSRLPALARRPAGSRRPPLRVLYGLRSCRSRRAGSERGTWRRWAWCALAMLFPGAGCSTSRYGQPRARALYVAEGSALGGVTWHAVSTGLSART